MISENRMPTEETEILTTTNRFNEIILNGLKMNSGINLKYLLEVKDDTSIRKNIDKKIKKWPSLILSQNHLKLRANDFMLLDEVTADLFI